MVQRYVMYMKLVVSGNLGIIILFPLQRIWYYKG